MADTNPRSSAAQSAVRIAQQLGSKTLNFEDSDPVDALMVAMSDLNRSVTVSTHEGANEITNLVSTQSRELEEIARKLSAAYIENYQTTSTEDMRQVVGIISKLVILNDTFSNPAFYANNSETQKETLKGLLHSINMFAGKTPSKVPEVAGLEDTFAVKARMFCCAVGIAMGVALCATGVLSGLGAALIGASTLALIETSGELRKMQERNEKKVAEAKKSPEHLKAQLQGKTQELFDNLAKQIDHMPSTVDLRGTGLQAEPALATRSNRI